MNPKGIFSMRVIFVDAETQKILKHKGRHLS